MLSNDKESVMHCEQNSLVFVVQYAACHQMIKSVMHCEQNSLVFVVQYAACHQMIKRV